MPRGLAEKEMSDLDSNDEGEIPATAEREDEQAENQVNGELKDEVDDTQNKSEEEDENDDEDDYDDDDEEEDELPEDEYEVEAIKGHEIRGKGEKKTSWVLIKWKGFKDSENTWEPEENLNEDSKVLMQEYFTSVGGRPGTGSAPKKAQGKRKSRQSPPVQATPAKKSKRNTTSEELSKWTPHASNWEPEIERVDTVDRDPDTKKLNAYIIFKNGKRVKVGMEMVHKHCPRAMLRFYEEHLKFT